MRGLSSVCFLCLFSSILSSPPEVFEDYFNEDVKVSDGVFRELIICCFILYHPSNFYQDVPISENIALKACLESPNDLIDKISNANRKCFSDDGEFDWKDFAKLNGV